MATLARSRIALAGAALLGLIGCVPPSDLDAGRAPGADAGDDSELGREATADAGDTRADSTEPDADAAEPDAGTTEPDAGAAEPDAGAAEPDAGAPDEVELVPVPGFRPAVAAAAGSYLTAWVDERGEDDDIYAARLDADGAVLDIGGIAISTEPGNESTPAIATDGDQFLVVWMDRRDGGTTIHGARVALDGTVLDPAGLRISPAGHTGLQMPDVASTGDGFVVVYEGRCGVGCFGAVATPVSASGTVGAQHTIAATGRSPDIVADGSGYLVAYSDVRTGAHDLYARHLDADGAALGDELELATAASSQVLPAIAAGAEGDFLVVWQDLRNQAVELYGARITTGGVVDPGGFLVATSARWQDGPELAFAGGQYLVSWSRAADDGSDVELRTVLVDPATGAVTGSSVAATAPSAQSSPVHDDKHPALAAAGDEVVLAWQDRPAAAVYGQVLAADGTPISAEPIALAVEPAP